MPLACSCRHLGGSEPTHRAPQVCQSFWVYIFKERLVEMVVARPPWFHWSFLFLVNVAALIYFVCINAMVFVPMAQAPPKAGAEELLYSLNLIHKFTSLFSTSLLYVGLPRKAFAGKQAKVDTGHQCFSVVAKATPQDSPKASPMAIFKWKNLIGQLNPLLEWMLNESWRRLSLLSSTCQHVAKLQFVSCAEEASLCGRVVMAWI